MFNEISEGMEKFFTPVSYVNNIINASNADVDLLTLLNIITNLDPDPKNYKRVTTFKSGNNQFILVINSKVERLKMFNLYFKGYDTSIYLFPEKYTMDDGTDRKIQEDIVACVCSMVKHIESPTIDINGSMKNMLFMYASYMISASVLYNTYKARVSIDDVYNIINTAYHSVMIDNENTNSSLSAIVECFEEDIQDIMILIEEVGIYKLLDCSFICGKFKDLTKRMDEKINNEFRSKLNEKEDKKDAE